MKLLNPTDDQLNAAFAEHVAGWTLWKGCHNQYSDGTKDVGVAKFTTSADAVLPHLDKSPVSYCHYYWPDNVESRRHKVHILGGEDKTYGLSDTFSRAAVLALLRAHGVEVVFDS